MKSTLKLIVLATLAVPSLAFSYGIRIADQNAFAAARGDAFVATADNPSAIYYNPAGMTQLAGDNLRSGFYGIYASSSYKPLGGNTTYNSADNLSAVPQLFYVHSLKEVPLSFGLGVYFP